MKSDIEISRETQMRPIEEIASQLQISAELLEPYGHYIAKVPDTLVDEERIRQSKLILVTAISPTKAGNGKTTVSVGLTLGMQRLGYKAVCALREPSLGPCFGIKGGACGGGYAQVVPMEKINLHFTGDFHAVTSAHNMISALLDNYLYHHQEEGFRLKQILWRRVLDVNDRCLRRITTGQGPATNGIEHESGFDITPASELMAILCLATSLDDLRRRIDNILLGITEDDRPFYVRDMGVGGAITVLLMDAVRPNLVQTTEGTPAFIHGGPFANIAHGCSSVLSARVAMTHADYCITEAGFGADLGAEKFYDILCRKTGLQPALTVLVVTTAALELNGYENLDRHVHNLRSFGQTVVVALNRYAHDTDETLAAVQQHCAELGVGCAVNSAFTDGGRGAEVLAQLVVDSITNHPSEPLSFCYADTDSIEDKIRAVATRIYGAGSISLSDEAQAMIARIEALGMSHYPICIAKTQYSFSTDPKVGGAPSGFDLHVRDLVINAGAEMIVVVAGAIMRMPGLSASPNAERITLVDGQIEGLS